MDSKLLKPVARFIATPVSHILIFGLKKVVYPQVWKTVKIISLSMSAAAPCYAPNSRPISLLPALSKIMERIVFEQIPKYF